MKFLLMLDFLFPFLTTGPFNMEIGTTRVVYLFLTMLSFVMIGDRCCIGKQVPWFSRNSRMLDVESIHKLPYHVFGCTIKPSNLRFVHSYWGSARKNWMSNVLWRTYTMPVSMEESSSEQPEDYSDDEGNSSEDLPEEPLDQPLSSDEDVLDINPIPEILVLPKLNVPAKVVALKALLLDSQRTNLTKKLSEANQQNRFLKRQTNNPFNMLCISKVAMHMLDFCISQVLWTPEYLPENFRYIQPLVPLSELHQQRECNLEYHRDIHGKVIRAIRGNMLHVMEDALVNFKSELAVMELETQALVTLSEEIAQYEIPEGSRKINGKYVQSHLLSRLRVLQEKLKEQIKDVDAAKSKEVSLFWCGMAESVQVMGSFDGWSQGEHLSPEYDGSFTKFSATLMLRPGRYEIKFLVDGDWQLSPEYPTIGEGLTENNLLIVE
ncbi:hypothetical protein POTOM_055346 [Populus tomentosa]|uniref:AMP-activated protein kinase glycogen-binding domain-containing protein n=1 Tax=Populus tomentosa TaxID=118781 RepID=A0A8X7Y377_POPTO|nr:hypothetical protein POTOM_055346 [Populus tomentosa]